ncbi:MAG: hypothetical protein KJ072_01895 [Verrucomicrobia bacterium]|nr:hypothetical protein [Verrucomicrobiota bacterium]
MVEWNIQSRGHVCHACGEAFGDGQPYHTLLLDARGNYERLDVCERCWAAEYRPGAADRSGFVSHWQGVYEIPAARPEPIQKETAESLLRKLVERNHPADAAATFILAVMLERKRILKVKDQLRREGRRVFVYEHARTGDAFTIADPDLHLDQLEEVQRDVSRLLEQGAAAFEPGGATAPAVPASGEANAVEGGTADVREPGDPPAAGG